MGLLVSTAPCQEVKMRQFVALLALAGVCLARPHVNSGVPAGPLTPAVGDLVATPKGYRSLALEGFSEDLDQDGFVDPIGQAVPVVQHVAAPVISYAAAPAVTYAAAPAISYAAVKPVEVKPVEVKAAPVPVQYTVPAATVPVVHTAPVVQHIGYNVHHQVHHVPQVAVQKHTTQHVTHHVINHAPVVGAFTGLLPAAPAIVAAPAAAEEAEAPAVVEA